MSCVGSVSVLERTQGVEFYASEILNQHTNKTEWKGVKKINSIEYTQGYTTSSTRMPSEIRVWQSWKVGPGKVYHSSDFEQIVQEISPLNIFHAVNVSTAWIIDSYEKDGEVIILLLRKVIDIVYRSKSKKNFPK